MPLFDRSEARRRAGDPDALQLTGYGHILSPSADTWEDAERLDLLAAAMTFVEQRHVVTSELIKLSPGDTVEALFEEGRMGRPFPILNRRESFGPAIGTDDWSAGSRPHFLNAFLKRFEKERPGDPLRLAFFRHIEISRLSTRFVELHHFLAFSALELLARNSGSFANNRNAAVPIADLLNREGFPTTQIEIETWTGARNAAFHYGQLVSISKRDGSPIRLVDQLYPLSTVVCDLLLKLLPFDDGHINWNRWRDHMGFK